MASTLGDGMASDGADVLARIAAFLDGIGIPVQMGPVAADSFLPGIGIEAGALIVDPARLRWPGDLLHEAGHLALLPPDRRATASAALDGATDEAPVDEVAAIAWSWAALQHLGLPPALLFHDGGYRGQAAGLRLTYELGVYPGAAALAAAGLCRLHEDPANPATRPYPQMTGWLRT